MHCLREVPARALPGRRQGFHAVSATVPCWGVRACSACLSKPFLASHDTVALSFCIRYPANITMELPSWLRGKESACQCRTCGFSPWVGMIPGGGNGNPLQYSWASLVAQMIKNPPAMQESWVRSLRGEDTLKDMFC